MTPEKLKQLAEFAAEFLGLLHVFNFYFFPSGRDHVFTIQDSQIEDYFFHNPEYAPQLAHLALREMENQECEIEYHYTDCDEPRDKTHCWEFTTLGGKHGSEENKNNFIALWSAIMATLEE